MKILGYPIDTTFTFHLRCAAWITFVSAVVTFMGAVYFRFDRYDRLIDEARASAADATRIAAIIRQRTAQATTERAVLEDRLLALAQQQAILDTQQRASQKAPFPIENVLSSEAMIVCIDPHNSSQVYSGSGTVFSLEGLILTNHHLLVSSGGGTLIKLCGVGFTVDPSQPPRIKYAARVLASDTEHDMAVLRITESLDGTPLPPAFKTIDLSQAKTDSAALGIGDPVYIGGYPGIGQETFTFTEGVVSGRVADLIKTSALIDSGTSGGSAFDAQGRFIGIPSAAIRGEIGGSLGFVISGEAVDNFLTDYYNGKNLVK